MAKIKNKIGPTIILLLLVVAIMVLIKPPSDFNRETYGSSREGFSREGASSGVCTEQGFAYCYWSKFTDQGIDTSAQVAFSTSYNTQEGIKSYSFCDPRDPVTNAANCYAGEYYYPFKLNYLVKADFAYMKISSKSDDWITCNDAGCTGEQVSLSDEIIFSKEELSSKADVNGKVYVYLYAWDGTSQDYVVTSLPNDFGDDVVLDTPEFNTYTAWSSQGSKILIYTSSVGACLVDDDCHEELLTCQKKGQCLPVDCVRSSQCAADQICSDNNCLTVDCKVNSDCNDGFCSGDNTCVADIDGDLIADSVDNCPYDFNPSQADVDKDGLGDVCDSSNGVDHDNDGILNEEDNCPLDYNPYQEDLDGDGLGDVCDPIINNADRDLDGINNIFDNCPDVFNPYQFDWDNDGLGDECDYYDQQPKVATVQGDGGSLVYTFTVAEPVQELTLDNGSVIKSNNNLPVTNGRNYYLYFIIGTIGAIVVYESVRKKK